MKRRSRRHALYVQIPDSDQRGVTQAFEDAMEDSGFPQDAARILSSGFANLADAIGMLLSDGWIVALDEFQYFNRKSLAGFQSFLQAEIDKIRRASTEESGFFSRSGLFTLGSIHTEMTAILEDKASPLFNRVTDRLKIGHWDGETLFEMFRDQGILDRHHQLFLWSIFEGVPKFYRDCFDQGVLVADADHREKTLRRLFFEGSSPLRDEARTGSCANCGDAMILS